MTKGAKLHQEAEDLRETDNLLEALKVSEESIVEHQKEGNYRGIADSLQTKVLTYKHLFLRSQDKAFAILALKDAEASIELAKLHNIQDILGACFFRLGEVSMLFEEYNKAADYYRQALDNFSGTDCERGDYRYHLGEALYKSGQEQEGLRSYYQGLTEIQENVSQVEPFLASVWESGCHMHLAYLLKNKDPQKAEKHLDTARRIIESDKKLIIRKRQLKELEKVLNY